MISVFCSRIMQVEIVGGQIGKDIHLKDHLPMGFQNYHTDDEITVFGGWE